MTSPATSDAKSGMTDETIADMLEFEILWEVDGLSTLVEDPPDRTRIAGGYWNER